MKFRLNASEHVGDDVRRIVFELIDHAKSVLTPRIADEAPQRVHEARKSFKKVRAVIRLVRSDLGVDLYRAENRWFRDAGRQLSHLRDADAMLEAIHRLSLEMDPEDREGRQVLEEATKFFLEQRETAQTIDGVSLTERVRSLADDLEIARRRVAAWPLWSDGFEALGAGFQRTYREARGAFRQVRRAHPSSDRVHEWRKRTKYHWYHMRLFDDIGQALLTPYRTALDSLAQLLGEHQDLAVLTRTIARVGAEQSDEGSVSALLDVARRRQEEIRERARIDGERIFAERPRALRKRMGTYWQAWLVEYGHAEFPEPAPIIADATESNLPIDEEPGGGPDGHDDGDDQGGGGTSASTPPIEGPAASHDAGTQSDQVDERPGSEHDISVAQLATMLGVSRRLVYQWMRRQWIAPITERPYRFSAVDVERLRHRLDQQQTTRDLCEQVMQRRGVSYDAARAWVARRRRAGMTDAEIVKALLPRQPSMTRKAQRFANVETRISNIEL